MTQFQITPEILAGIAGVLLSLAFSYVPGVSVAFASLKPESKRLIMAGMLAIISVILYLLNCKSILWIGLTCDQTGIIQLVTIFISSIVANQGAFSLTPQTQAVKAARKGL